MKHKRVTILGRFDVMELPGYKASQLGKPDCRFTYYVLGVQKARDGEYLRLSVGPGSPVYLLRIGGPRGKPVKVPKMQFH